jgi:hypothetical protein
MSDTGRYWIHDQKTGRRFCVEPISERNEKLTDKVYKNGGTTGDSEKNKSQIQGGSIHEEDSIITEENGFNTIVHTKPGESPIDVVNRLLKEPKHEK